MPTEAEIIADIRRVGESLGKSPGDDFTLPEYNNGGGNVSTHYLHQNDRRWSYYVQMAGFSPNRSSEFVSDDGYFARLREALQTLGEKRPPKPTEQQKFRLNFRDNRWKTFNLFLQDAARLGHIPDHLIGDLLERDEIASTPAEATTAPLAQIPHRDKSGTRPVPPIPRQTKRKKWQRTDVVGHPYEPHDETGVIALFAILCAKGTIPWQILTLDSTRIDAICAIDEPQQ